MGGAIPANALFLEILGAYTLVFAFGLEDELQHSPNEYFRLSSFERGQKAYGMLLNQLGEEMGKGRKERVIVARERRRSARRGRKRNKKTG
jgi:hypothetical protein